ncbi:MAG: hypothetical protein KUA37_19545 [Desulfomicrobium sp.]|nr:hypothetical protein [Pseudomonadota bacterium]MBV1714161.1 hypothetical protein [Desulfomicrobium sp.]MBU4570900.1 hypothetical protein [Pseudomonadota bacterium]MBU4594518.1 hypothetical protein [Pseudomonadota bacterium]MBV1718457.1 hypothetical protein [Desulfomicrobium sp.]
MTEPRQTPSLLNFKPKTSRPSSLGRRIFVALAVTGVIGTALVITLTVLAARFVGGAVDYLQSIDMTALQTKLSEADLKLDQHQREIIEPLLNKLKNEDLSLPQREEIGRTVMENLGPEQRNQLEALENIEAAGSGALDQLLASVVRKLEELGVPIGMLSAFIQGNGENSPSPQ